MLGGLPAIAAGGKFETANQVVNQPVHVPFRAGRWTVRNLRLLNTPTTTSLTRLVTPYPAASIGFGIAASVLIYLSSSRGKLWTGIVSTWMQWP